MTAVKVDKQDLFATIVNNKNYRKIIARYFKIRSWNDWSYNDAFFALGEAMGVDETLNVAVSAWCGKVIRDGISIEKSKDLCRNGKWTKDHVSLFIGLYALLKTNGALYHPMRKAKAQKKVLPTITDDDDLI